MTTPIGNLMTTEFTCLDAGASALDAARCMRDQDIGAVLVIRNGRLCGIVTDRDLTVRCLAEGNTETELGELCSAQLLTAGPDDSVDDVIELMSKNAVRRVPIVDTDDQPVGILSLGDVALERDPQSALGRISGAPANR